MGGDFSFWNEYLDLVFLFKMMYGLVHVSDDVIPEKNIGNTRGTRATSNPDTILLHETKCRTVTFQRSFSNRSTRIWNILPDELKHQSLSLVKFKSLLLEYYCTALHLFYEHGNVSVYSVTRLTVWLVQSLVVFSKFGIWLSSPLPLPFADLVCM